MADYINTTELDYFQLAAADVDSDKKEFAITAASRYFDRLAEVETDFFAVAAENPTEKVIQGNGLSILLLPPFVGELGDVVFNEEIIDADSYLIKGKIPNQFLEFPKYYPFVRAPYCNLWQNYKPYTISARWGWSEVPAEVKTAVIEMAIAICAGLDVAKAKHLEEPFSSMPMIAPDSAAAVAAKFYKENAFMIGI